MISQASISSKPISIITELVDKEVFFFVNECRTVFVIEEDRSIAIPEEPRTVYVRC